MSHTSFFFSLLQNLCFIPLSLTPFSKELVSWNGNISFIALYTLMVQQVKNPPVIQETMETWVRSLGWDDPLEEENGNPLQYFLPEKSHGQRSLVGYSPKGCKELDTTKWVSMHAHTVPIFQVLKQKFLGYLLLLDAFMLFYLFLLTTLQGSGYYSHLIQLRKLRVGQLISNKVRIWT